MVRHLRATASRGLSIWRLDPERMAFASFSGAGGAGANGGQVGERARGWCLPRTRARLITAWFERLPSGGGVQSSAGKLP
eukprot:4054857-Pyramimonas_sp.AAC.2